MPSGRHRRGAWAGPILLRGPTDVRARASRLRAVSAQRAAGQGVAPIVRGSHATEHNCIATDWTGTDRIGSHHSSTQLRRIAAQCMRLVDVYRTARCNSESKRSESELARCTAVHVVVDPGLPGSPASSVTAVGSASQLLTCAVTEGYRWRVVADHVPRWWIQRGGDKSASAHRPSVRHTDVSRPAAHPDGPA